MTWIVCLGRVDAAAPGADRPWLPSAVRFRASTPRSRSADPAQATPAAAGVAVDAADEAIYAEAQRIFEARYAENFGEALPQGDGGT